MNEIERLFCKREEFIYQIPWELQNVT